MHTLDLVDSDARLRELWQIDKAAYQNACISLDAFRDWWSRYDLGLRVVVNHQSQIVGAVGIWALSEQRIRMLISGQITEGELKPEVYDELHQNPSQFWYISGIVAEPGLQKTLGTPLRRLLHSGVRAWAASPHLKFPVHCYALGYSLDGIALLDKLKFEVIKQPDELPDGLPLYWRSFDSRTALREALR